MSLPSTPDLLLENLTIIDLNENETVGISANQYDMLDRRVCQAVFSKNKDGTVKKCYVSRIAVASFQYLPPHVRKIYLNDEVKEMKQQWKEHIQRMDLKGKRSTLLTAVFEIL